jgi:hypothetical protein
MRIFWIVVAAVLYLGSLVLVTIALRVREPGSEDVAFYASLIALGLVLPPIFAGVGRPSRRWTPARRTGGKPVVDTFW